MYTTESISPCQYQRDIFLVGDLARLNSSCLFEEGPANPRSSTDFMASPPVVVVLVDGGSLSPSFGRVFEIELKTAIAY